MDWGVLLWGESKPGKAAACAGLISYRGGVVIYLDFEDCWTDGCFYEVKNEEYVKGMIQYTKAD